MIGPDDVHVWTIDLGTAPDHRIALADWEIRALRRLRLPSARTRYARRHALLRSVLSGCRPDVDPAGWTLAPDDHGKPHVVAPAAGRRLRFSTAHCGDWACVAVTLDRPCGVDIEDERRPLDTDALARIALNDGEQQALSRSPAARRREILRRWTLKESFVKALGVGLRVPLQVLSTDLDPPRVAADLPDLAGSGDHRAGAGWHFGQWVQDRRLVVAVAAPAAGRLWDVHIHDRVESGTTSNPTHHRTAI